MYDCVVLLHEDGVLGLASFISDGIKCEYWIDGVAFVDTFGHQDYEIIQDL